MLTADQIAASHSDQLMALHELSDKALRTVARLTDLQVQTLRSTLDGHAQHAQAWLSTTNPQDLLKWQQEAFQPLAQKLASYSRDLFQIAVGMSYDFSQLAESHLAASQQHLSNAVDAVMKNVPNGAESIQTSMESMLASPVEPATPARRRKAA